MRSELVQLKLNLGTSVGESTPTEAEHGTPDGHGGPSVAEVHDSNRTFEVRAPPWMARCRDGGKRPLIEVSVLNVDKMEMTNLESSQTVLLRQNFDTI